jgi:hypothetical protein
MQIYCEADAVKNRFLNHFRYIAFVAVFVLS